MAKSNSNRGINGDDFVTQSDTAKSAIRSAIRDLSRRVNRHKWSYDHLRYIFRAVRAHCEIEVPTKREKLYELPTHSELKKFFGAVENPTHRLIFDVLLGTGLRVSELINLEVRRIDFKSNTLFVSQGKGSKDRIVVVGDRLLEKLRIYLHEKKNRYLFESRRSTKFSSRRIQQLCKHYQKKAGIRTRITPHVFRHQFFTALAEKGVAKEVRMIIAGHQNEKVQDRYTHLSVAGMKDQLIKILDSEN